MPVAFELDDDFAGVGGEADIGGVFGDGGERRVLFEGQVFDDPSTQARKVLGGNAGEGLAEVGGG